MIDRIRIAWLYWASLWVTWLGWPTAKPEPIEVFDFPLSGDITVRYPGLTRTQANQFDTVYDKVLELRQQADDVLVELDALANSFSGNGERATVRSA